MCDLGAEAPDRHGGAVRRAQRRHRSSPGEESGQEARLARQPVEIEPPRRRGGVSRSRPRSHPREVEDDLTLAARGLGLVGGEGDRLGRGREARTGQSVDRGFQPEQQLGVRGQAARILGPGDPDPTVGPLPEPVEEAEVPAAQGPAIQPHGDRPHDGAGRGCPRTRPSRGPAAAGRRPVRAADRPLHQQESLAPGVPDSVKTLTAARILKAPAGTVNPVVAGSKAVARRHDQARAAGCLPAEVCHAEGFLLT
ncbi:hypothetical protein ACU4GR_32050 [Methylobacterium oryzae CBMB20]